MTNPKSLVVSLLGSAKKIYAEILEAESGLKKNHEALLVRAWRLGEVLTEMKEEIGHGKWLIWLDGHWPQLGERNAQRCMQFYRSNDQIRGIQRLSTSSRSQQFSVDSIRKFMWGYIPEKERPKLEGNEAISPAPHYLTFLNHFIKWDRQHRLGHAPLPPLDQIRREFEPVVRRQIELLGRDWFLEILKD